MTAKSSFPTYADCPAIPERTVVTLFDIPKQQSTLMIHQRVSRRRTVRRDDKGPVLQVAAYLASTGDSCGVPSVSNRASYSQWSSLALLCRIATWVTRGAEAEAVLLHPGGKQSQALRLPVRKPW